MEYCKEIIKNTVVFHIKGDFSLNSFDKNNKFDEEYNEVLVRGDTDCVIDLSQTNFIDSRSIGILIKGSTQNLKNNRKVKLSIDMENEGLVHLLKVVNISLFLDCYADLDDAIEGMNKIEL